MIMIFLIIVFCLITTLFEQQSDWFSISMISIASNLLASLFDE